MSDQHKYEADKLFELPLTRAGFLKQAAVLGLSLSGTSALLTACGGTQEESQQGDQSFEGQTLNVLMIQPHAGAAEILKKEFESATKAKVNVTTLPYEQSRSKMALDVQSGANEFDVFDYWYVAVGEFADQGTLEDLTEFIEGADIEPGDFIQSIYDPYTLYDGKRYGLPFDGDTHILFYNTEILNRNDVLPPATWEEYLEAARKITEAEKNSGIYGCAMLGKKSPFDIGSSYTNRLAGFGGAYFDAEGVPALDSESAVAAAEAMVKVAPYALPTPLQTSFNEALPAFLRGDVAMIEFWTDLGVFSQDPEQSKIVDKWGAVQLPVGGENTDNVSALNAGYSFGVSAGSNNKELAWEFVKFAASKKTNLELITTTGSGIDPIRKSTVTSEEYKKFAPKIQEAAVVSLDGALAMPTDPSAPALMNQLIDELALALQGKKEPQTALADAQESWQQTLSG